jgi:lysozyme family protein
MANSAIEKIILDVIEVEGDRYTNDPTDAGGPTKYGITLKTLSAYRGVPCTAQDVKNLTQAEAFSIYRHKYVVEPGFDRIERINTVIAAEVIDTGVNMGPSVAAKFLQRSLNALNYAGSYPLLAVDGVVGAATLKALQTMLADRGVQGEAVLLMTLNSLQTVRYVELTETKNSQRKYFFGWLNNRVFNQIKEYVGRNL